MISLSLIKDLKCILQIGGSDQWGNIVNGTDLIKRKEKKTNFWLNHSFNNDFPRELKWVKTEKGAIWLNEANAFRL